MNPLDHPIVFEKPLRLTPETPAWHGHIPFALFLVDVLEPRTIVELGTHYGDSYCAFCQAVAARGLGTRCSAVDTWAGDPQAGEYGPEVLAELREHHDPLYGGFSRLLQMTFDEALPEFRDGEIDLLHIDGCHTYEAVKHDFEAWLPKLSERGVVLLHDTSERGEDFGVWRLWEELAGRYPHLELPHSHGLGLLAVGREQPAELRRLLEAPEREQAAARDLFAALGERVALQAQAAAARRHAADLDHVRRVLEQDRVRLNIRIAELERDAELRRERLEEVERRLAEWEAYRAKAGWRIYVALSSARLRVAPLGTRRDRSVRFVAGSAARALERLSRRRGDPKADGGAAAVAVDRRFRGDDWNALYKRWLARNELSRSERRRQRAEARGLEYAPTISILTPVYNTDPTILDRTVKSVLAQTYERWELCLVNDGSDDESLARILDGYAAADDRVRVKHRPASGGIAVASNDALALAMGEYIALLDHDDELAPDALFAVARLLNEHPDADMIYSDEDKIAPDGTRCDPFFKPAWSPDYFLSCMYTCHLGVYRRTLVQELGGFREGFEGAQDYDLVLRVVERTRKIHHIPRVLYHWRMAPGSTAAGPAAKPHAHGAAQRAIAEHLERSGLAGRVEDGPTPGFHRVRYDIREEPLVSIVIPTAGTRKLVSGVEFHPLITCVESVLRLTSYAKYELVCVLDGEPSEETAQGLRVLADERIRVVSFERPFNFAEKVNFGAAHARGTHLVLLNDDTDVLAPEWLTAMLELSQLERVGAVGAKLYFPTGEIQHGGVVVPNGAPGHAFYGYPRSHPGYFCNLIVNCNYLAVSAACMMTRRDVYDSVGGFTEEFPLNYNDVDYCLKVRERGHDVVFTPYAELRHFESLSRDGSVAEEELRRLWDRWGARVLEDPFYNRNFQPGRDDFVLAA